MMTKRLAFMLALAHRYQDDSTGVGIAAQSSSIAFVVFGAFGFCGYVPRLHRGIMA